VNVYSTLLFRVWPVSKALRQEDHIVLKVCSRETRSPSRAFKIYGHNAFQITHTPLSSTVVAQHNSPPHTLWGCAVELASALTAATILADASVTPLSPKWSAVCRVGW